MSKAVRESDVEKYLVARIKAEGGEIRKVKWVGRRNAPDRIIFLQGLMVYVELKRPGKYLTEGQQREAIRLRAHGAKVTWANNKIMVDQIISWVKGDRAQGLPR